MGDGRPVGRNSICAAGPPSGLDGLLHHPELDIPRLGDDGRDVVERIADVA